MKKILVLLVLLSGCASYQLTPVDKCCETDVVYLEDIKNGTTVFSTLDFNTITLDFQMDFYRHSNWYWGRTYGYWGNRPLWMDFGNYYSFNRPWNYWDWYMRPWRPYQHNQWSWYNGPYNNQGYNVVYNSSRRNNIENKIVRNYNKPRVIVNKPRVVVNKPIVNKPVVNNKPIWNNNKPIRNNNRPTYNNSRPVINNNSRPNNNSRSIKPTSKPITRSIKGKH